MIYELQLMCLNITPSLIQSDDSFGPWQRQTIRLGTSDSDMIPSGTAVIATLLNLVSLGFPTMVLGERKDVGESAGGPVEAEACRMPKDLCPIR